MSNAGGVHLQSASSSAALPLRTQGFGPCVIQVVADAAFLPHPTGLERVVVGFSNMLHDVELVSTVNRTSGSASDGVGSRGVCTRVTWRRTALGRKQRTERHIVDIPESVRSENFVDRRASNISNLEQGAPRCLLG